MGGANRNSNTGYSVLGSPLNCTLGVDAHPCGVDEASSLSIFGDGQGDAVSYHLPDEETCAVLDDCGAASRIERGLLFFFASEPPVHVLEELPARSERSRCFGSVVRASGAVGDGRDEDLASHLHGGTCVDTIRANLNPSSRMLSGRLSGAGVSRCINEARSSAKNSVDVAASPVLTADTGDLLQAVNEWTVHALGEGSLDLLVKGVNNLFDDLPDPPTVKLGNPVCFRLVLPLLPLVHRPHLSDVPGVAPPLVSALPGIVALVTLRLVHVVEPTLALATLLGCKASLLRLFSRSPCSTDLVTICLGRFA
mmetsp:Transcript_1035/g.1824  ORF Transcript_1035/g.1824 Transcript_1035/m.1824 type:complete len:310 (-) Transcript_1035:4260-5189(-)